jgi:hypothetical protein
LCGTPGKIQAEKYTENVGVIFTGKIFPTPKVGKF